MMPIRYDVTVIVCTFNRAELLRRVLQSVSSLQTADEFSYEVLVVDNASTDHTQQVVADAIDRYDLPIRIVREQTPGPAAARNRGMREARGEWLAFLDDDELADSRWLYELFQLAHEKKCQVVGGAVQLAPSDDLRQPLSPLVERLLAPGGRARTVCPFTPQNALNSGNAMSHRSVAERVGPYDEDCVEGGEDTEWFLRLYRLGITAWYTPQAVVQHLVPDYRLSASYLRWVSMRRGWSTARQDANRRGGGGMLLLAACRLAQLLMLHLPLLSWAQCSGAAELLLFRKCQFWRMQGYLRNALRLLSPNVFSQEEFRCWIEFRGERQQFSGAGTAP